MVRQLKLFFSLGSLALLLACEQPAENGLASGDDEDINILPGTEASKDFGDYVVHFNALTTDHLTPDIARDYGIVRSQNRAMLTVSILRKTGGESTEAVPGAVSASAINLTGQLKNLAMREIKEQDAIYYIGELAITDAEVLIFTVDVTPNNDPSRFTVRFKKQFFVG